jgi:polyisoprenyl-teichoic acid--peptidoglycan teichoic acid transferase
MVSGASGLVMYFHNISKVFTHAREIGILIKMPKPSRKKRTLLKKIAIGISLLLLFVATALTTFLYFNYKKIVVTPNGVDPTRAPNASPTPTPDPQAPFNVLLLGYGGAGHEGGDLTDTMIVAHVEPKMKKVTLISVPRDLWVAIPTNGEQVTYSKINYAYGIGLDDKRFPNKADIYKGKAGGGVLAKYAVGNVIGQDVRYFASIDFGGFKNIIDSLGGVDVNVPRTFDDNFYPIKGEEENTCGYNAEELAEIHSKYSGFKLEQQFTCRYEKLHFDKGITHMDGETALKFVRSRHSETDGSDFARSGRQQALIQAAKDKVLSLGIVENFVPFVTQFANVLRTDVSISEARKILDVAGDPREYKISTIVLSTDNVLKDGFSSDRQYILLPKAGQNNFDEVHKYIETQLNPSPTPSKVPLPIKQ